ncbi:hypothetical protein ACX12E_22175 [Paenibacillus vandeheii]
MLVNVNHDGIGLAEIVFSPKVTVSNTAFDYWLLMAHFYHLDIYCLRTVNELFSNEMPDDDMGPSPQFQLKKTQKNRHKGGFVQFAYKLKN